jgi:S4 domain protein YaaA
MDRQIVQISDEFITLGQFLKHTTIISSGGMAKPFLAQYEVYVNEEAENRRGKKLYDGDTIDIPEVGAFVIEANVQEGT